MGQTDAALTTFIARQAIVDRSRAVYAYELLYRSGLTNRYEARSSHQATTEVILNALMNIGMRTLVAGKLAFVNFDRELLLGELSQLLPEGIVIEVLESVLPDRDVIARCRELRMQGFKIALDDVTDLEPLGELITVADFVKVDFRATDDRQRASLARAASRRAIQLIAEKVETSDQFEQALSLGYTLAQGYFLAEPKIITGSALSPAKMVFLGLLREINQPDPDLVRIEEALKREPALVYKLLRFLNSATFAWQFRIDSIRHALALLGTDLIRKWIGLLALSQLSDRCPPTLIHLAICRARFCELICSAAGFEKRSSELFLLGMLSLFDVILGRPMREIIEHIDVREDIRNALLGETKQDNTVAAIYSLVLAYEAGAWDRVDSHANQLGLSRSALSEAYAKAVRSLEELDNF